MLLGERFLCHYYNKLFFLNSLTLYRRRCIGSLSENSEPQSFWHWESTGDPRALHSSKSSSKMWFWNIGFKCLKYRTILDKVSVGSTCFLLCTIYCVQNETLKVLLSEKLDADLLASWPWPCCMQSRVIWNETNHTAWRYNASSEVVLYTVGNSVCFWDTGDKRLCSCNRECLMVSRVW